MSFARCAEISRVLFKKKVLTSEFMEGSGRGIRVDLADVEPGVRVGQVRDGQNVDIAACKEKQEKKVKTKRKILENYSSKCFSSTLRSRCIKL